jgi:hypothetical protein
LSVGLGSVNRLRYCAAMATKKKAKLESILTCPTCTASTTAKMPTDACQWYFECPQCHDLLRPKPGDCCVFCSYGDTACPPIQLGSACG